MSSPQLWSLLEQSACSRDIPLWGGVDLDQALQYKDHLTHYKKWLADGLHGEMAYLERGFHRREDPARVLTGAKSVFCVGIPYRQEPVGSASDAQTRRAQVRYARYLAGRDYHDVVKRLLDECLTEVTAKWNNPDGSPLEWKSCVDTSAVLERSWGFFSGLGWIGKNTMLIHPKVGSYFFIGVALLNVKMGRAPVSMKNYCGRCERCVKACPTGALQATPGSPGILDSNQCISYLTLEKRGTAQSGAGDRITPWIAGCDVCQEVCPFTQKAAKVTRPFEDLDTSNQSNLLSDWDRLNSETPGQYQKRVQGTSLERVRFDDFQRNLKRLASEA